MKNIIRTFNLIDRFSKFTLNIKIYEEFEEFLSKVQTSLERNFVQVPLRLFQGGKSKQSDTKITFYDTKYSSNKTKMTNVRIKKSRYYMVSRSLVLNKILQKHMGNRSKNTKKDTLRPKDKEFVETKEQKWQREGKSKRGFWCGIVYIQQQVGLV